MSANMSELQAEIVRLKAEKARLLAEKAAKTMAKGLSYKISEKGGLSVYGMGRWPVTLYREQWERLLNHSEELKGFMAANESRLKSKGDE
jgi:hypothetical protein